MDSSTHSLQSSAFTLDFNYRSQLKMELSLRRARNPHYSLRSFARDLGVSPTALSEVLAAKREFSLRNAQKVAHFLHWSPGQTQQMFDTINSRFQTIKQIDEASLLQEDIFFFISDWYYLAILNLAKIPTNRATPRWISQRLGLTSREAEQALSRLLRMKMLSIVDGQLVRKVHSLRTGVDIPSRAIRKYHRQNLLLAEQALETVPINFREFSSVTTAISLKNIPKAKDLITKFKRRLAKLMENGEPEDVYTLSIHLFPAKFNRRRQK